MAKTVVGLFRTPAEAQKVKQQLVEEGFSSGSIRVLSNESDGFAEAAVSEVKGTSSGETSVMGSIKSFFHSLTSEGSGEQDYYTRGVSSGGALLAATVPDERADAVAARLEAYGAADVTEDGTAATAQGTARATNAAATSASVATGGTAIPVVEEELQVGKRQVQRGGVRVYSHVVETPVEEAVRLREEHVRVQRSPVNRPASAADFDSFKEGTIELTETGEEAVVAKQARVVEEVTVGKDVTERTATIKDKIRHTEVEVEEIPGEITGKGTSAGKLSQSSCRRFPPIATFPNPVSECLPERCSPES